MRGKDTITFLNLADEQNQSQHKIVEFASHGTNPKVWRTSHSHTSAHKGPCLSQADPLWTRPGYQTPLGTTPHGAERIWDFRISLSTGANHGSQSQGLGFPNITVAGNRRNKLNPAPPFT
eukprot:1196366-Prorocentrum_minimum.AAC.4